MPHGKVSLLEVVYGVDEREIVTEFFAKRIVAKEDGIMNGFLQRFNLSRIEIVAQIVAKRPDKGHVGVGVFEPEKVFTTNPSFFVVVLSVKSVNEERRAHPVDVVDVYVLIFSHEQRRMAHGASATEQIHEVGTFWQEAHDALCQFVFAALIR